MRNREMIEKSCVALVAIASMCLAACSPNNQDVEKIEYDVPHEAMFLAENEWAYYDPTIGEAETLSFIGDGTFYYNCECGEPIGNSDVYDVWRYDIETKTAYMSTSYVDEQIPEVPIRILRSDDYRIVVEISDEIKSFEKYDMEYYAPEVSSEYSDKLDGYSGYLTFNKLEGNVMTVSPYYYDGDIAEHRDLQHEEIIAENATFHYIDVQTVVDKDGNATSTSTETEMTWKDLEAEMEDCSGMGFVWYNEDLEIEKILFYGEIINYE